MFWHCTSVTVENLRASTNDKGGLGSGGLGDGSRGFGGKVPDKRLRLSRRILMRTRVMPSMEELGEGEDRAARIATISSRSSSLRESYGKGGLVGRESNGGLGWQGS